MIIVTGAGGKTGQTVVRALAAGAEPVRALVHRPEQVEILHGLGAQQAFSGDICDPDFVGESFRGARAVYHICPNMSPDEIPIAENVFSAAKKVGIEHFVYHSVLHPQVEAMPHHWQKMRVEERLFSTGLAFTILQPGAYMQNILGYWDGITREGIYAVPYTVQARISMVDLEDVAQAAARVLREPGHMGAVYELAGPEPLSQVEVAEILSEKLNRTVVAQTTDRSGWEKRVRAAKMDDYAVETLLKMFVYYENFGLVGNPRVLGWLLGRPPCRFSNFVERIARDA